MRMISSRWDGLPVLLFSGCLALVVLLSGCLGSAATREAGFIPGIYEGTSRGYRGPIYVQVQVSAAGIEDITVTSNNEDVYPGETAIEELLEAVLEYGTTDLDAVSGATISSRGFLEAVDEALEKAKGNVSDFVSSGDI